MDIDIKGKLFPSLGGMIVSAIVVAILFIVVKKFFWEPITSFLEKRAEYIQSHVSEAETLAVTTKEEYITVEKIKDAVAIERKEIIDEARNYANKLSEKIISEAKSDAEVIIAEAKNDAEAYRTRIKHEIYTNIALRAAEKITQLEENGQEEHPIIKEFLNKLEEL